MALPKTLFIDRLPLVSADIKALLQEYHTVEHLMSDVTNHNNATLVQRKFHLKLDGVESPELSSLTHTSNLVKNILSMHDFNSVTYRMIMPNTCYNWHVDTGKTCVHVPLITNPGCKFVYERMVFSMPADGSIYVVNNEPLHTFINAGSEPRVHLTFENL